MRIRIYIRLKVKERGWVGLGWPVIKIENRREVKRRGLRWQAGLDTRGMKKKGEKEKWTVRIECKKVLIIGGRRQRKSWEVKLVCCGA